MKKEDLLKLAQRMCLPLYSYYKEGTSTIILHNRFNSNRGLKMDGIEMFLRPFWAIFALKMNLKNKFDIWEYCLNGIKKGVDPDSEFYWGDFKDYDQKAVESAILSIGLMLIPEYLWEELNEKDQKNLSSWLYQINSKKVYENNWIFFRILANIALRGVKQPYDDNKLRQDLNTIDEFYLGNGWYSDGKTKQLDYYISFAFHFYGLILAKNIEKNDYALAQKFKKRAELFAKDYIYYFSQDGSAIPFGRSLVYKSAQSAFWGALAYADVEVYDWSIIKGLFFRNINWWLEHGLVDENNFLTIGYTYSNQNVAEGYISYASVYWALKMFLPLMLNETHGFWKATEVALPELQPIKYLEYPQMLICREPHSNHVFALTSGQKASAKMLHKNEKYEKFVYSNYFGFSISKSLDNPMYGAFDSMIAFSKDELIYRGRSECESYKIINDVIMYSSWTPMSDIRVETWLVPVLPWHVRIHRINTCYKIFSIEGGFSFPLQNSLYEIIRKEDALQKSEFMCSISSELGTSCIVDLLKNRVSELVIPEVNTNIMYSLTAIPSLVKDITNDEWVACAVYGGSKQISTMPQPHVVIEQNKIYVTVENKMVQVISYS